MGTALVGWVRSSSLVPGGLQPHSALGDIGGPNLASYHLTCGGGRGLPATRDTTQNNSQPLGE